MTAFHESTRQPRATINLGKANGETIDFYADSAAEKDGWMKVLADVVGKDLAFGKAKAWTDLVLAKQRAASAKSSKAAQGQTKAPPTRSAPPTPSRKSIQQQQANLAPPENSAKHHSGRANHPQTRSMLF